MRRILAVLVLALAACSGGDDPLDEVQATASTAASTTTEEAPTTTEGYPTFDGLDPRLDAFFIALEDTDLAEDQGEERLHNLGVSVCQRLDDGATIEDELTSLIDEANLAPPDAGGLIGAAVAHRCEQHTDAVQEYVDSQ